MMTEFPEGSLQDNPDSTSKQGCFLIWRPIWSSGPLWLQDSMIVLKHKQQTTYGSVSVCQEPVIFFYIPFGSA